MRLDNKIAIQETTRETTTNLSLVNASMCIFQQRLFFNNVYFSTDDINLLITENRYKNWKNMKPVDTTEADNLLNKR